MNASKYDGQYVVYVDPLKIAHTGVIVGESDDGKWLYVQSDRLRVKPADWHFKILAKDAKAFIQAQPA